MSPLVIGAVSKADALKAMLDRNLEISRRRMPKDVVSCCVILQVRFACAEQEALAGQVNLRLPIIIEIFYSRTALR